MNQFGKRGHGTWTTTGTTTNWEVAGLILRPGTNLITVTIVDSSNHSGSVHLAVSRKVTTSSPQSAPVLTGMWNGKPIVYQVWNGMAVIEGDIILGPAANVQPSGSVSSTPGAPTAKATSSQSAAESIGAPEGGVKADSLAISYTSQFWPKVGGVAQIPYIVTGPDTPANLTTALGNFNSTFSGLIQFVPVPNPASPPANYVDIDTSGGSGEGFSDVGMVGGEQSLDCGDFCTIGTWLHEMGHTVGLQHEHQRADRGNYITLNLINADIPQVQGNFTLIPFNSQNIGLFDHASIMEYGAFDLSKAGLPVIESIPPGMPLSNDNGYSAGDIDGVERLYGAAPTADHDYYQSPGFAGKH